MPFSFLKHAELPGYVTLSREQNSLLPTSPEQPEGRYEEYGCLNFPYAEGIFLVQ